jgi:hypothetical protein
MKFKFTFFISIISVNLIAQTITYTNFSTAISTSLNAVIANQASFNLSLSTITGNGVTWNASGLTQQSGTPNIAIIYGNPASTPNGSLFPNSNYVQYDPALTALLSYDYVNFSNDSIVRVGQYEPSTAHEIYTNPDKGLIFPFALNQSFVDSYAKTNYSDATTISSFQTGTRTVTYAGFGTLILPQGTFNNVALIVGLRTNSLGPDSYTYTWYEISTGKQLLFYSENNGSVTIAYNTDLNTGIVDETEMLHAIVYPNPAEDMLFLKIPNNIPQVTIYNTIGQSVNYGVLNHGIDISFLKSGLYVLEWMDEKQNKKSLKFQKK